MAVGRVTSLHAFQQDAKLELGKDDAMAERTHDGGRKIAFGFRSQTVQNPDGGRTDVFA